MTTLLLAALQRREEEAAWWLGAILGGVSGVIGFVVAVILIVAGWKVFEKAGKPGWAAIVPIYNLIILLEIIGKPMWWIVLCLIPCVNLVAFILIAIELARVFGKSTLFAVGLIVLPFVFYPVLAFGDARYRP